MLRLYLKTIMLKLKTAISWTLRIVAAVLLLQTLFFKFTGAEESIYIFSKLGVEPWGRILTGILELIAALLLLVPRTSAYGAMISTAIMTGAVLSHIFILGISVQNDKGLLFIYALIVLTCSVSLLLLNRQRFLAQFRSIFPFLPR